MAGGDRQSWVMVAGMWAVVNGHQCMVNERWSTSDSRLVGGKS